MDIFVVLCLWNGALMRNSTTKAMLTDDAKLESFINNALIPMVKGLAGQPGLGGYEIFNEPEGSVYTGTKSSNPCFDTVGLDNSGAGWAGAYLTME